MNTDEKQILMQAKTLIQLRDYEQARTVLEQIPHHPKAQEWLAKIDQILPRTAPKATEYTAQFGAVYNTPKPETPPFNLKKPLPPPDTGQVVLEPWNPQAIGGFIPMQFVRVLALIGIFAVIFYSRNWKRLGKADWMVETFLIGLLITLAMVGAVVLWVAGVVSTPVGAGAVLAAAIGNFMYVAVLERLQMGAYKKWAAGRNYEAMLNHRYDLVGAFLLWFGATSLLTVGIAGAVYVLTLPKTYEDEVLHFEYSSKWEKYDANWATFCNDPEWDGTCFLTLTDESYTSATAVSAVFYTFPNDGMTSANTIQIFLSNLRNDPEIKMLGDPENIVISGVNAQVQEYLFSPPDDLPYYQTTFYIPLASKVLIVAAWTQDADVFEARKQDLREFIQKIELKNTGL